MSIRVFLIVMLSVLFLSITPFFLTSPAGLSAHMQQHAPLPQTTRMTLPNVTPTTTTGTMVEPSPMPQPDEDSIGKLPEKPLLTPVPLSNPKHLQPAPATGTIGINFLGVRTGPGTDYPLKYARSPLVRGERVGIINAAHGSGCLIWLQLRIDTKNEGWVCGFYVDLTSEDAGIIPDSSQSLTYRQWQSIRNPDIPPDPPLPLEERFAPAEGDIVTEITPGIIHIARTTSDPLQINILLFDITAPEFDLKVALGDNWLSGRTRTTYMAKQNEALAAINGDVFSGFGDPEGFTIIDSTVVIPPKHRATFAWSKNREPFIGYFTDSWSWEADVVTEAGERYGIAELNRLCSYDDICLFNEFNRVVPDRGGEVKVFLDKKGNVYDITYNVDPRIPKGTRVLQATGEGAEWLLDHVALSDTLTIHVQTDPPVEEYAQAISGGPIILQEGEFVQDCLCKLWDCRDAIAYNPELAEEDVLCEDFDTIWKVNHYENVFMPRTGIGIDRWNHTLIAIVVDGYQAGYSRGILQTELADLFVEFGAYNAMEFDGGGSSTMVLHDTIMNNPSDGTGERHVSNSLLFFWDDKECRISEGCSSVDESTK